MSEEMKVIENKEELFTAQPVEGWSLCCTGVLHLHYWATGAPALLKAQVQALRGTKDLLWSEFGCCGNSTL